MRPPAIDDEAGAAELAEMIGFVADFLARAEGPLLRWDFAEFTYGSYTLDELRADLRRFAGRLAGEAAP
jgi:hypothetical protein